MQCLVKSGAGLPRAYYRNVPLTFGERPVWNSVVQRLIGHDLDLEATARFGARMHFRFPDTVQSQVAAAGDWEPGITAYLTRAFAPGDIVIGIGAEGLYDHGTSIPEFPGLFRRAGFAPFLTGDRCTVDMYLEPASKTPRSLTGEDFKQLDILFRRE
jgi:hypothetical protein